MLARYLELAALDLDLAEEARVLDGEGGLGGEGLQQLDRFMRKLAGLLAIHRQRADEMVLADERHGDDGAVARFDQRVADGARIGADRNVSHLNRFATHGQLAENALIA